MTSIAGTTALATLFLIAFSIASCNGKHAPKINIEYVLRNWDHFIKNETENHLQFHRIAINPSDNVSVYDKLELIHINDPSLNNNQLFQQ